MLIRLKLLRQMSSNENGNITAVPKPAARLKEHEAPYIAASITGSFSAVFSKRKDLVTAENYVNTWGRQNRTYFCSTN